MKSMNSLTFEFFWDISIFYNLVNKFNDLIMKLDYMQSCILGCNYFFL